MIYHQRLLRSSAAPVAAVLITLGATNASALSMGKLRVQSALGQNLVAEIDLADLSDDEAASLRSELAAPGTFAGMGLEYNNSLNGTQIALQRRQNGSRYLKVTGTRALNDPFVDILVELSWASGKIVRTYTILLDPPKPQDVAATPALPAQGSETQIPASKVATPATAAASAVSTIAATNTSSKVTSTAPAAASVTSNGQQSVKVSPGDNAGKFARAWAAEGVSVEQMLVAMLNANPAAFAGGNVNRLLANTELLVPEISTVKKTSKSEAQRLIQRHNQDFQNLRRTLAGQAPTVPATPNQTETAGKVTSPAPAANPKTSSGDTLKLSKGSSQDVAEKANMEQIAQQRAKNEASERARELAKNIEELNQLAKVAAKPESGSSSVPPVAVPSSQPQEGLAASATPAASETSKPAIPAVVAAVPRSTTASSGDWLDSIFGHLDTSSLLLALAGLLGGLGWYRRAQSRKKGADRNDAGSQWNSSANTSFAVGGAQSVDTSEVSVSVLPSSMYQESQLELANELDPVAEAEVYLAYGKDVPAEEILKEGLQQTPNRVAIHLKLLAIYAKRGDAKSFESIALDVKSLTQGAGPDWGQVLEMGLATDPTNPLYKPGVAQVAQVNTLAAHPTNSLLNPEPDNLNASEEPSQRSDDANSLVDHKNPRDTAMGSLPLPFETPPAQTGTSFELSSMSLSPAPVVPESGLAATERLDATLALAQQFLEIGEKEGALALIAEVMAGGNEALRKRATELLAQAR